MTCWLRIANLAGVLALAALCLMQWRNNRTMNLELQASEKARLGLVATVERQVTDLEAKAADLDEFRARLLELAKAGKESDEKLALANRRREQLELACDQLKSSVSNWVQAVTLRDEQIQSAQAQRKELMADRNRIVTKFNELTGRHAQLVQQWNDQQARLATAAGKSAGGAEPTAPPQK